MSEFARENMAYNGDRPTNNPWPQDSRGCASIINADQQGQQELKFSNSALNKNKTKLKYRKEELKTKTEGTQDISRVPLTDDGKKVPCCVILFLVVGMFMLVVGVAMISGGFQALFNAILKIEMQVREGSISYEIWRTTPVPLIFKTYFFNITNPDDFKNGEYPILQEIGPYAFRENHLKQNINHHDNNTVTYYQQRWWTIELDESVSDPREDILIQLNSIPVSAAFAIRHYPWLYPFLNGAFNGLNESIIVKSTVMESLFDGYEDEVLNAIHGVLNNSIIGGLLDFLPSQLTQYDRMGWFYKRNMSLEYDGLWNMNTGEDDLQKVGSMDWWNYMQNTTFYGYPCNKVSGSAGEIWPPNQDKTSIHFFNSDVCSTLYLDYEKEVTDQFGLKGYRYSANENTFTNGSVNSDRECFSVDGVSGPTGTLNAQSCRMGAPAFVSFPHFLYGDPCLRKNYPILQPDVKKHGFYIDLIPDLGVPIGVAARMQINIHVQRYNSIKNFVKILKDVKDQILPLFWFEVQTGLTEDLANQLKLVMFLVTTPTMTIIWSIMIVIGFCMVAFSLYKLYTAQRSRGITVTK